MIGLVIVFPQMVTFGLDKAPTVDANTIQIEIPVYEYDNSEPPPSVEPPAEAK
jgi:hypothetical protein